MVEQGSHQQVQLQPQVDSAHLHLELQSYGQLNQQLATEWSSRQQEQDLRWKAVWLHIAQMAGCYFVHCSVQVHSWSIDTIV